MKAFLRGEDSFGEPPPELFAPGRINQPERRNLKILSQWIRKNIELTVPDGSATHGKGLTSCCESFCPRGLCREIVCCIPRCPAYSDSEVSSISSFAMSMCLQHDSCGSWSLVRSGLIAVGLIQTAIEPHSASVSIVGFRVASGGSEGNSTPLSFGFMSRGKVGSSG